MAQQNTNCVPNSLFEIVSSIYTLFLVRCAHEFKCEYFKQNFRIDTMNIQINITPWNKFQRASSSEHHVTVDCRYNAVQYNMILRTSLQWLNWIYSEFQPKKDTPYLALAGELWGVFCDHFGENG